MKYKEEKLAKFFDDYLSKKLLLAIEQRAFVWDSRNVIQLLDSICRGIPMGTIILGKGGRKTPALDAEKRVKVESANVPIIYDGQQRILSLQRVFVKRRFDLPKDKLLEGKKCRVWIDVDNFSKAIDSKGKEHIEINGEKSRNTSLLRFKYRGAEAGCYPFEIVPDDETTGEKKAVGEAIQRYVKRKRTFGHASTHWKPLESVVDLTRGACCEGPEDMKVRKVREFIWRKLKKYKVCLCEIGAETDIENLFLRINRAGQPVSDEEQYFAALKQRWPSAEEELKGFWGGRTPFGLLDAVHLVVYLAHNISSEWKKNGDGKYVPLRLRDFSEPIVGQIQRLIGSADRNKDIKAAIERCTKELSDAGGLKYGVNLISPQLMAMAMASVIGALICEEEPREKWKELARYLFVIDQSKVLSSQKKDTWSREIFKRLWSIPFPEAVQEEIRKIFDNRSENDRIHELLWLSVFQGLSPGEKRGDFDIDHMVPSAWVRNKWNVPGELKKAITLVGNMWIVNSGKNREWRDKVCPADKFRFARQDASVYFGDDFKRLNIPEDRFKGVEKSSDLRTKKVADDVMDAVTARTQVIKKKVFETLDLK